MDLGANDLIDSNLPFVDLNSELIVSDVALIKKKIELTVLKKKILFEEFGCFRENLIYSSGLYTGQMLRNKRVGIGIFIFFNNVVYHGYWDNDRPNGPGILKFDCSTYEGNFLNGNFDGFGKFYTKGYKYKGFWKNNQKCGNGNESVKFGSEKYVGEFFMNKRHGEGALKINNKEFHAKYNEGNLMQLKRQLSNPIEINQTDPNQYTISKPSKSGQICQISINLSNPQIPILTIPNHISRPLKLLSPNSPQCKLLLILPPNN